MATGTVFLFYILLLSSVQNTFVYVYGSESPTASTSEVISTTDNLPVIGKPSQLNIAEVTEYTINVTWWAPDGDNFDAFLLFCNTSNGKEDSQRVNKSEDKDEYMATCVELTAGALYNVSVQTLLDSEDSSDPVHTPAVTVPLTPGVEIVPVSADTLRLELSYHDDEAECTHYNISWQLIEDKDPDSTLVDCAEETYNIKKLQSDGEYEVGVRSVSDYGDPDLAQISVEEDTATNYTFPESVDNLTLVSHTSSSLYIEWNQPKRRANIIGYTLMVSQVEGGDYCVLVSLTPESGSPSIGKFNPECIEDSGSYDPDEEVIGHNVCGLEPWTLYNLTVKAYNPAGSGEPAKEDGVRTGGAVPGPVSNLISSTDQSSLTLTWQPPDNPNSEITHYKVCWYAADGTCDLDPPCEANTTEHCDDNVTDTTWFIDDLCPYRQFFFSVQACSFEGCGEHSNDTNSTTEDVPAEPTNLRVKSRDADFFEVKWDIGPCETGNTSYTLCVQDSRPEDPPYQEFFETDVHGFNTTSATLISDSLTPYWPYHISVTAITSAGNDTGHIDGTERTGEDAPGPVEYATSEAVVKECYHMLVKWEPPTERNMHGIITSYHVHINERSEEPCDDANDQCMWSFPNDTTQGYVPVNPNNKTYIFIVAAVTSVGEGNGTNTQAMYSGICSPLHPVDEEESAVQVPENKCANCDKTRQFEILLSSTFLNDGRNGEITNRGFIVVEDEETDGGLIRDFDSLAEMNELYGPWSEAKKHNPMTAYRATADDWDLEKSKSRRAPVGRQTDWVSEIVGGSGECNNVAEGEYCNGYVKSDSRYRVRAFICTQGGCLATAYSSAESYFVTEKVASYSWILGLVFGLVFAMLIVVLVLLAYLRYRKEQWPFNKSDEDIGGSRNDFDLPEIDRHRPVAVAKFMEHVDTLHKDSDLQFAEEYKDLKDLSPRLGTVAAELPQCRIKNRYTNILAFDHSRVKLLPIDDDEGSDYINANYMVGYNSRREFIAAQGPLDSTIDDFWRLIWEQNVPMIVMLTRTVERGREKCAQYWPRDNEAHYYGDLQVQMRSESTLDSYTIRVFDVRLGETCRTINQYHYTSWPDFGCPENTDVLLKLVSAVRADIRPNFGGPILIHCSAGVGRTGTFICVDRLLQRILDYDQVDIFGIVVEMRSYRAMMVQTEDQYIYIHDCLREALQRGLHLERDNLALDNGYDDQNLYENTQAYRDQASPSTVKTSELI